MEDLAGCVLDMALQLQKSDTFAGSDLRTIRSHIGRYYETLEKLKILEENEFI